MMQVTQIPQRLARWFVFSSLLALATLLVAGRIDLPMLNAWLATSAGLFLVASLFVDPELMKERLRRRQGGEDPRRLLLLRVLFVAFLGIALLDIGRFHWSDTVPRVLQVIALLVTAAAMAWTFWAVAVNRFFVPVIRLQPERGHRVVSQGPYAHVRHPGYAGTVLSTPASALALGSWAALVPALAISVLFVLRAAHEDRFLR